MARLVELIRLLEAYDAPEEERNARSDMLALARGPNDPFARDHFTPGHFTASGFVVSPDGERLLLIHHRRLDRWVQPGGHIDPTGEHVIDAAVREVEEETGVGDLVVVRDGLFDLDVHDVPSAGVEPAHAHFDIRFLFQARSTELTAAPEVRDAAWVPLDGVAAITTDPSVVRAVDKLRERGSSPVER